jgi:hypothetical protein
MEALKTVAELCADHDLDCRQLAEKTGLQERRIRAIIQGNWTPSPQERDRVAAAFGLTRDQVAWGHKTVVSHLYGHGPQFGRSP